MSSMILRVAGADETPDVIEKGFILEVVMKHGDWWSEIKKGVPLLVLEGGRVGGKITFKEEHNYGSLGGIEAKLERASGGKYKLLVGGPFKRALTVKIKDASDNPRQRLKIRLTGSPGAIDWAETQGAVVRSSEAEVTLFRVKAKRFLDDAKKHGCEILEILDHATGASVSL